MDKSEKVYSLLSNILGKDDAFLKAHSAETRLWDSLKRIEIVFSLEEQFDATLSPEEIAKLNTVQDILETVEKL